MDEWVLLRRYDDGFEAELARNFLRDHGIAVGVRGNSGATSVINRFDSVLDVRLVVRREDLALAREALHAMEAPPACQGEEPLEEMDIVAGHPYRAYAARGETMPRYRRAAFALALVLPIGAGHFYAREETAGLVFAGSIAATLAAAAVLGERWLAAGWMLMALADAVGAVAAVRRHNAGAPLGRRAQALRASGAVMAAMLIAAVVAR